jgi:hypothetical protein
MTTKHENRKQYGGTVAYQGMNWITKKKRLAIYLRDGMQCAYCKKGVEDGIKLSLDHLKTFENGGTHNEANLVTCCSWCNTSRSNRSLKVFCDKVAGYINHGATGAEILAFIRKTVKRKLDTKLAQELIDARGGFTQAVYSKN